MSVYFDPSCAHRINCFKRGSLASGPRGNFFGVDDQVLSPAFVLFGMGNKRNKR